MALYPFETQLVLAGDSAGVVVTNASITLYAPSDTTLSSPIALKDASGLPVSNPLQASAQGFLPAFQAEVPQVLWSGGGYIGYINSFDGVLNAALAAQAAAEAAATGAAGGVPAGGSNGQVLGKVGGMTQWVDQTGGGSVNAGDVDTIVGDLVGSGTGATVGSLDQRYRQPGIVPVVDLPAGATVVVRKTGSTWPARPTNRTDIVVIWVGADPDPAVITSGTGGAMNNVDIRMAV